MPVRGGTVLVDIFFYAVIWSLLAGEHVDFELVVGAIRFGAGLLKGVSCGKDYSHSAMSLDFRLAEYAHLRTRQIGRASCRERV